MRILSTALKTLILASSVVVTVAQDNDIGTPMGALAGAIAVTAVGAAASAFAADARVSAEGVEKGFVSDGSKRTYHEKLVLFSRFLLENHSECIADDHRDELLNCHRYDKEKETTGKKSRRVQQYMQNALKAVHPATSQQPHNSPIKIDGEGAITYEIVQDFMQTKTNTGKVDRNVAQKYLNEIDNGDAITDDMVEEGTGKVTLFLYQSYSTFSAICSLISYLYKLAGVERPKPYITKMNKFMGGMKRITQAAKQHLGLKLTEGKLPMPLKVYNNIAKKLFFSGEKEDVFCHLFFVLDWCLMK